MTTGNGPEPPEEQLARAVRLALSLRDVARDMGDRALVELLDVVLLELADRLAGPAAATARGPHPDESGQ